MFEFSGDCYVRSGRKRKPAEGFQMSRMIIPGSTYWNMGYGLNKGEVLEDKEGLSNMRHVGKCIDWLGKAIKPDIANYPK